jgi:hypothetical protein
LEHPGALYVFAHLHLIPGIFLFHFFAAAQQLLGPRTQKKTTNVVPFEDVERRQALVTSYLMDEQEDLLITYWHCNQPVAWCQEVQSKTNLDLGTSCDPGKRNCNQIKYAPTTS